MSYSKRRRIITGGRVNRTIFGYVQFIFLCIFLVLILSVFLYLVAPTTFQSMPLYFPSTSAVPSPVILNSDTDTNTDTQETALPESTQQFVSELRTVPRQFPYVFALWREDISDINSFLNELIVGPRSIYLKALIPEHVQLQQILQGEQDGVISSYVIFSDNNKLENDVVSNQDNESELEQQEIQNWLQYNVDKYFSNHKITVVLQPRQ